MLIYQMLIVILRYILYNLEICVKWSNLHYTTGSWQQNKRIIYNTIVLLDENFFLLLLNSHKTQHFIFLSQKEVQLTDKTKHSSYQIMVDLITFQNPTSDKSFICLHRLKTCISTSLFFWDTLYHSTTQNTYN